MENQKEYFEVEKKNKKRNNKIFSKMERISKRRKNLGKSFEFRTFRNVQDF